MGSGPTLTGRRSRCTHAAEAGNPAPAPARPPRCRCEHRGARGSRRVPRGLGHRAHARRRTGYWRRRCCCPRWWSVVSWRGRCGYRRPQLWMLGLSTLEGDRNQVGLASVPQVQRRRRTGQGRLEDRPGSSACACGKHHGAATRPACRGGPQGPGWAE